LGIERAACFSWHAMASNVLEIYEKLNSKIE